MAADNGLVLLTGATGFVGQHLLAQLSATGRRVRAVVRGDLSVLPGTDTGHVEIFQSDDLFGESDARLREICDGCDSVIHAAWIAEPGKYLTSPLNLACLDGTVRLAEAFAKVGGRRFVGIGTCFEYDLRAKVLSIDTPLAPDTLYAACKTSTFHVLSALLPSLDVSFAWCRLFYLFGQGEREQRLVPYLRTQLADGQRAELTSGRQIRDFMDVADAARAIIDVTYSPESGPVNICSGIPTTVRQLAESIADEYGRRDLLDFGKREDSLTDPACVIGLR